MAEKKFTLTNIDPIEIYGSRNSKLDLIKSYYPKLKIIARGGKLTVLGDEEMIEQFETKLQVLIQHFHKYNRLTESNIDRLIMEDHNVVLELDEDVIVHGTHGKLVKARTSNQRKLVDLSYDKDMVFAIGPAGTGKTYTAVALAVRALKNKEVKRIILTRPAVEAGENLGFLPGDMKDKLDPYMQPLYDALNDMIPSEKLKAFIEERVIQIAPLAFMRGRTLDNAFVILDEAQNTTVQQMKMFLTRMGRSAKFVVTGDMTQIDLPNRQKSGLSHSLDLLKDVPEIGMVYLDQKDVIRHKLVMKIIQAYKQEQTIKENKVENTILNTDFNFPGQTDVYHGKVREVYTINNELLVMIVSDRISAFDVVMPKGIPYKGQVLNQIAAKFLDATNDIVPNWKIATPDPMVTIGKYVSLSRWKWLFVDIFQDMLGENIVLVNAFYVVLRCLMV